MSLIKRMGVTPTADEEAPAGAINSAPAGALNKTPAPVAAPSSAHNTEIALSHTAPLPRNTVLQNRYDIEQVLGIGGMSIVYRARDLRFSTVARYCAVKEMPDMAPDPKTGQIRLANFEREASLLATLSHPGIPKIYDFFSASGRVYLVLEFIDGKDLETQLETRGGPVMEEDVVDWGIQICDVLEYLHGHQPQPIIFRDLKPANIIVDAVGKVTLIDFGIAKVFQSDKRGTMIGTEGYAPPEQYRGLAEPRGDVYALGATMHHLLTNSDPRTQTPFTFSERPIRKFNPRTSEYVESVILRCVEYDIDSRWPNIQALRTALSQGVSKKRKGAKSSGDESDGPLVADSLLVPKMSGGEGDVGDGGDTAAITASRMPSAILETLGGSGMLQPELMPPPPPAYAPAHAPVAGYTPQPQSPSSAAGEGGAQVLWTLTADDEIRSSPLVERGVVFFGSYDTNLYALNAKSGDFIWKAPTKAGICASPAIHEDLIIFGSEDNYIYALDARRGTQEWSYRTGGAIRSSPRVHNGLVFVGSDDQNVYCLQANSGQVVWKYRTWNFVRSSAAVAGGLIFIGSSDGNLYALDAMSGTLKWKLHTLGAIISSPLVVGHNVIAGSMDNSVYAADLDSGFTSWRFECQHSVSSSATVAGGRVMIGSSDEHLYALDAPTGRLIWSFNAGGAITSSPRVNIPTDSVYFGSTNNYVYCLDVNSGEIKWRYRTRGPVVSSPTVEDGMVYVGSMDRKLYALAA